MARYVVHIDHVEGWSTGFNVESVEPEAMLLARLGREGVVIERDWEVTFYAPSQIKSLRISKED